MYRALALGLFAWFAFGSIYLIGEIPKCNELSTGDAISCVLALSIFMTFAFLAGRESRQ